MSSEPVETSAAEPVRATQNSAETSAAKAAEREALSDARLAEIRAIRDLTPISLEARDALTELLAEIQHHRADLRALLAEREQLHAKLGETGVEWGVSVHGSTGAVTCDGERDARLDAKRYNREVLTNGEPTPYRVVTRLVGEWRDAEPEDGDAFTLPSRADVEAQAGHAQWPETRDRRMASPEAQAGYEAARREHEGEPDA